MNKNDKRIFGSVKKVVRDLEPGVPYNQKCIKELCDEKGIEISNMDSVLQAIVKQTPYLQQLTNGNYIRTRK
ncbi:MAG: hypothetical protein V1678_01150 [Candidatus Aenigmatarchaeota archaeon]